MDMQQMMKQAQELQNKIEEAKVMIAESVFTSGEGREVTIHMYGTKVIKEIIISDVAMEDKEILQDLIAIVANECIKQIDDFTEEKLSAIAPGLGGLI